MNIKLLTEHHLEILSLKGGCTGSSESTFVKMPHCWNSVYDFVYGHGLQVKMKRHDVTCLVRFFKISAIYEPRHVISSNVVF